ncbi:MAG: FecR domain-containing protein [Candidatus Omnitrophica bacterium]|nr:FecR domain-containing protein [Candidatus Omnitrophota bacterium]
MMRRLQRGALAATVMAAASIAWAEPAAVAPGQVGVAAAVQGVVNVTAGNTGPARPVRSGQAIFLGDLVTTEAQSRLQILLLDQTVFTIGPASAIAIDEFVYDPSTDAGKLSAQITKGVFRFVSGRLAHKDPNQMKVKLPSGTIGVRGTCVTGSVEGDRATVALVSPGGLTVDNAGRQVQVTRSGFGTTLSGLNAPPSAPSSIPTAELTAMATSLTPTMQMGMEAMRQQMQADQQGAGPAAGQPGGPGPQMQQPGQPTEGQPQGPAGPSPFAPGTAAPGQFQPGTFQPGAFQPGTFQPGMFGPQGPMGPIIAGPILYGPIYDVPPPQFFPPPPTPIPEQTAQILDGISKLDQLRQIQTGIFHFQRAVIDAFHQTFPVDRPGRLEVFLDIDFGARTVGGNNSRLIVKTGTGVSPPDIDSTITIQTQSFASGIGDAVFTASGGGLSGTFTMSNAGGVIANRLKAEAVFDTGTGVGGKQGSGTFNDIQRQDGNSPPPPPPP